MAKPILIAGATASGKSALALALAQEFDGVIINTDSCQIYKELSIISARPSADDMLLVPHRLYGHVSGNEAYSTGAWIKDVELVLAEVKAMGKRPVFVGGTGLYFKALLEGLSVVPDIDPEIRQFWRDEAALLGAPALHNILQSKDPLMADDLKPGDTQRIVRALEVIDGTGRSLKVWQQKNSTPLLNFPDLHCYKISWDREVLYERINQRFEQMIPLGGLDEVRALKELNFEAHLPIMRALGVPELIEYLEGECEREVDLADAIALAQMQTRRYAKRQLTWLRRNMISWNSVDAQYMQRLLPDIVAKVHENG